MRIDVEKRLGSLDLTVKRWASNAIERGENPETALQPERWRGRKRLRITAIHELGHKFTARFNGWHVPFISVVPEGNTLGLTKAVPEKISTKFRFLKEKIALFFGGMMAEEKFDHSDHSGCGSDMGQANHAANVLALNFGGSPFRYLDEGKANARASVGSVSYSDFEDEAEDLMEVGQKAA